MEKSIEKKEQEYEASDESTDEESRQRRYGKKTGKKCPIPHAININNPATSPILSQNAMRKLKNLNSKATELGPDIQAVRTPISQTREYMQNVPETRKNEESSDSDTSLGNRSDDPTLFKRACKPQQVPQINKIYPDRHIINLPMQESNISPPHGISQHINETSDPLRLTQTYIARQTCAEYNRINESESIQGATLRRPPELSFN